MADHVPIFDTGNTSTKTASATTVGGNVMVVSGEETVAPSGGASAAFYGIAAYDAAIGAPVTCQHGGEHDLVSTGAITVGAQVEPAAAGKVAAHTEGTNDDRAIGVAVKAAAGNVCRVRLYK